MFSCIHTRVRNGAPPFLCMFFGLSSHSVKKGICFFIFGNQLLSIMAGIYCIMFLRFGEKNEMKIFLFFFAFDKFPDFFLVRTFFMNIKLNPWYVGIAWIGVTVNSKTWGKYHLIFGKRIRFLDFQISIMSLPMLFRPRIRFDVCKKK